MLEIYYKNIKDKQLEKLPEFKVGAWINVYSPSKKELSVLEKVFSLDKSLLLDALDPFEVPRIEREGDVIYFFSQVPQKTTQGLFTLPLLIAIGEDFVLTFSSEKINLLERFKGKQENLNTTQRSKFFVQLFSAIDSEYVNLVNAINKQVRMSGVSVNRINNKDIVKFFDFEKNLNDYLSVLVPTNAMLNKILSGNQLKLYEEDKDLVEDLLISNSQLIEVSRSNLKNIVNIRDVYSTIMSQDLNKVIKILTALTIILTVPTTIFSLYGMNVSLPLASSPLAFWMVILLSLGMMFLFFIIFIKNRWL